MFKVNIAFHFSCFTESAHWSAVSITE